MNCVSHDASLLKAPGNRTLFSSPKPSSPICKDSVNISVDGLTTTSDLSIESALLETLRFEDVRLYSLRLRNRNELMITLNELRLIAALAHIGDTSPKAASGTQAPL